MTTPTDERIVATVTEPVRDFVHAIRGVVARGLPPELTARLVSELFVPMLATADLLTPAQREGDTEQYRQHVLHSEPDGSFSVAALVWQPGQQTSIHDHLSWCVAGVYEGRESERRYRLAPHGQSARLTASEDLVNPTGSISAFAPPGDIHRVRNSGTTKAISIHVYGADIARLGTSIRRVYPAPHGDR